MSTNEIRKIKKHVRLNEWTMQVKDQQESGMSATAWCKLHNIKPSTFFSRLRSIRESTLQNTAVLQNNNILQVSNLSFAEIDIANMQHSNKEVLNHESSSNIVVNLNGVTVEIPKAASIEMVASILRVLKAL